MRLHYLFLLFLVFQFSEIAIADNSVVNDLIDLYQTQGASASNAERAKKLWVTEFGGKDEFNQRSCSSCHGIDITQTGNHVKTGKTIKAMAPSVNAERLTDKKKIEKWFKRNCKWTFARECTAQEKSDFLLYISNPVTF
jgi:hypothetical protein